MTLRHSTAILLAACALTAILALSPLKAHGTAFSAATGVNDNNGVGAGNAVTGSATILPGRL